MDPLLLAYILIALGVVLWIVNAIAMRRLSSDPSPG